MQTKGPGDKNIKKYITSFPNLSSQSRFSEKYRVAHAANASWDEKA